MPGEINFDALKPGLDYAGLIQSFGQGQLQQDRQTQNDIQQGQLKRQAASDARDVTFRTAAAKAVNPDGSIDSGKVQAAQIANGDIAGAMTTADHILNAKKAHLDYAVAQNKALSQVIGSAVDENSYQAAKVSAASNLGVDVSNLPPHYDPAVVDRMKKQALDIKDQLTLAQKDAELTEKARNDKAQNDIARSGQAVTIRGQDITAATAVRGQNINHADKMAEIGGTTGGLDANGIKYAADRFRTDGTVPNVGTGMRGAVTRSAIVQRAANDALAAGATGTTDAADSHVFRANASSLQKQTTLHDFVSTAVGTADKNGQLLLQIAKNGGAGTTGSPFFNGFQQAIRDNLNGNPQTSALGQAVNTYATELAKINAGAQGSVAPSDSSRHEILQFMSRAKTLEQLQTMIGNGRKESVNRLSSMESQLADTMKAMGSNAPPPTSRATASAPPSITHTATNAQGRKLGWNGSAWVPM